MTKYFSALILPLLLLPALHAQGLMPLTNEFLVNQQISGVQSLPHVASDEVGGYVIVWTEGNNTVKARRYGPDHQAVTDEFVVAASATLAKVYYWSEGRYLITWQGNPSGSRVLQADDTLSEVYSMGGASADIDMDIKDDVVIVGFVASQHIRLRKWSLLTNAWMGDHVQASEAPSNSYKYPQVRWTSTGGIVVVYSGGISPQRLYHKTFNGNLLAQTPEAIIHNTNGSVGVINVSINAHDDLLVYARFGVNGLDSFWGRVLDDEGTVIMTSVGNMTAPYAYYHTDCELFDNGKVVVTNNYRTSLNDPEDYNVRANYGTFPGSANNTGFLVASNTVSGPQRYPSVTKLPNGGFLMAWNGNGFQGDSDGVYARAFAGPDITTALPERDGLPFEVRPNPFHGQLYVEVVAATPLEVLDATGRVVLAGRLQPGSNSLQLEQLLPGTYLLRWFGADGTAFTHRVVKT